MFQNKLKSIHLIFLDTQEWILNQNGANCRKAKGINMVYSKKCLKASKHKYHPKSKNQLRVLLFDKNISLTQIDISAINDFSELFKGIDREDYSGIEQWDVSHVLNMSGMFYDCQDFNVNISNWDVSFVNDMSYMFFGAVVFNQPLENWDVSFVSNMNSMFAGAISFNQPLEKWNVSSVTDMSCMFFCATSFNKPLNNWNVSSVVNMCGMFAGLDNNRYGSMKFNQPLDNWNVSSVVNMCGMFQDTKRFNQPLTSWNVKNVTNMRDMFLNSAQNPLPSWYR